MYQRALLKFLCFLYMKLVFKGRADAHLRWLAFNHVSARARHGNLSWDQGLLFDQWVCLQTL